MVTSNDLIARDVIIADNDYLIRGLLRSILENNGFTVLTAVNGVEAVNYARHTRARLVILDLRMPRLDGFAACEEIRRLPGYADVPIVILTAFDSKDVQAAAQLAGATLFFAKPFVPSDLLHGIARVLGSTPADCRPLGPAPFVWQRRLEPSPLYGEPAELSEGRRVLNICRR